MMRIGCVPYLNARPLLEGLAAELAVPSALADQFTQGRYQAALLPVFETLRLPAPRIADGYGICSLGPVQSVIVAHRNPLSQTEEILLDPASRSSVNLLRILLKSYLKIAPRLVTTSNDPLAARLLIGDPALAFQRQRIPNGRFLTSEPPGRHGPDSRSSSLSGRSPPRPRKPFPKSYAQPPVPASPPCLGSPPPNPIPPPPFTTSPARSTTASAHVKTRNLRVPPPPHRLLPPPPRRRSANVCVKKNGERPSEEIYRHTDALMGNPFPTPISPYKKNKIPDK
jgi:hypothetical protein